MALRRGFKSEATSLVKEVRANSGWVPLMVSILYNWPDTLIGP